MKILIITHAAGTPDIGPNMRTYFLGRNMVTRGHEVHIVGSGEFHKYKNSPLQGGKYTTADIGGIGYHWLPTFRYKKRNYQQVINQIDFAYKLWLYRKKWIAFKPDIVIVSSPPPFGLYIGKYLVKKCQSKLIFEIRDLWPEIICELGSFSKRHPYIKLVEWTVKAAYRGADGIVSVKPGDLGYIAKRYTVNGITRYIPNGYDHTHIIDEAYNHSVFKGDNFRLIYTGSLSSYYAIEYLLYAAEKLKITCPKVKIIIVGDGEDKLKYLKLKEERALHNVEFLGFLPKRNMLSVIRQCDATFLGLRDTGANQFGISTNKLFEYMFAEKPVIASYNTDYDLIQAAECGISVPAESTESIYRSIVDLYKMSLNERQQLGLNGKQYLLKHHTFERITDLYLKFIMSI